MTREPFPGQVIAFDPGGTTGVAVFNGDGTYKSHAQLSLDELTQMALFYQEPVSVVVYERWITFAKKARGQAGSRQPASQAIGMIKVFASRTGARLIDQPVEAKDTGSKITQIKEPSDHSQSHQIAAYNHGAYFLDRAGLFRSQLVKERLGE